MTRIFIPQDVAALAVGANKVAAGDRHRSARARSSRRDHPHRLARPVLS